MPRLSALIEDFAERFNFEPTKVASLARTLREAGQLTQGARGVNAPAATSLDAARLLIAMMLNCRIPTVAEDVALVGSFAPVGGKKFSEVFAPQTLETAISGIIDYFGIEPATSQQSGRYDGFQANVRLIPYRAMAVVTLKKWIASSEDWEPHGVIFSHPTLVGIDASKPGPIPEEYLATLRRFPAGFNQEPELDERAIMAIGQIVAGHQPLHWTAA